jgi:hypothetical protein
MDGTLKRRIIHQTFYLGVIKTPSEMVSQELGNCKQRKRNEMV